MRASGKDDDLTTSAPPQAVRLIDYRVIRQDCSRHGMNAIAVPTMSSVNRMSGIRVRCCCACRLVRR